MMKSFRELYKADMTRYNGKSGLYLKVFHFLYRRACTATFVPLKLTYKVIFRMWANRNGLEIPVNQLIGGGYISAINLISPLIPMRA